MRLAVFASGGGTNFQAILDTFTQDTTPIAIVLCVSNKPTAGALTRAKRHDIPTATLNEKDFTTPDLYATTLLDLLKQHSVDFIALAGYLKKIPLTVVQTYRGRILNIHPALLPAFGGKGMYGMHVHRAVLDYGVRWTGATVHLVDEEYDTGPIVLQAIVPVKPDDTPASLAARVLEAEHQLYPKALRLFAEARVLVEGRRVHIAPPKAIP